MEHRVNIFEYIDFKQFLKEWRLNEKKLRSGISHEYLSTQLGQKSRSFFSDIENGRRVVGPDSLDKFIKLLSFKGDESRYFRALVNYAQHTTYKEKEYWFEQIVSLNHTPRSVLPTDSIAFYGNWYHTAIRSLLEFVDVIDEYDVIVKQFGGAVSKVEVETSVALLLDMNLIQHNSEGFLKPTDKIVSTGKVLSSEIIQRFHLSYLQLLQKTVEKNEGGTHDSTQLTLGVSSEGLKRVSQKLEQFRSEVVSIAHKDEEKANQIINISLHAFRLTQPFQQ